MKKVTSILIAIITGLGAICCANGQVTTTTPTPAKVSEADGNINGHGYIDLGLPSGLKWATCNVGANSPEGYGDYYAWGETKTKSEYTEGNSLTYNKSVSTLQSEGIISSAGNLNRNYDAASANWGSSWRMPTKAELDELISKCKWTWTTQNGKNGYKVTGPNGKSIFVPAAGRRSGASLGRASDYGLYWSSTVYDDTDRAYSLFFCKSNHSTEWGLSDRGFSVRPVSE